MKNNSSTPATPAVEALLAIDPDSTPVPAMKVALENFRNERAKKDAELALERLKIAQAQVDAAVSQVRALRQRERVAVTQLGKVNKAMQDFVQNGDWDAWKKAFSAL
jgi:hypothetical protein